MDSSSLLIQFDYEWREGSREVAKQIAIDYVNEYRHILEPVLMKLTREQLVAEVEAKRNQKNHADRIIIDMWLLSEYPPQSIEAYGLVTLPDPRALIKAVRSLS